MAYDEVEQPDLRPWQADGERRIGEPGGVRGDDGAGSGGLEGHEAGRIDARDGRVERLPGDRLAGNRVPACVEHLCRLCERVAGESLERVGRDLDLGRALTHDEQ